MASLLDLFGILGIGWLGSSLAFSFSDPDSQSQNIQLGSIDLPSISVEALPLVILGILGLFLSKAILSISLTNKTAHFLAAIEARAARSIVESAYGVGLEGSKKRSREEVTFAVQIGAQSAFGGLLNAVGSLVAEGFLFVLILSSFIFVDPGSAFLALVYFGIIGFLIQFFLGKLMQNASLKIAKSTVEANSLISDINATLKELSILGRKEHYFQQIFSKRTEAASGSATQVVLSGLPRYVVESALIAGIAAFILAQFAGGDITSSAATIGIFMSGGLRLTASLLPLQSSLLVIKVSTPPALRALEIIEETASASKRNFSASNDKSISPKGPIDVSLSKVSFKYSESGPFVVKNLSLEIPPGSQAAFIGASGAGKSTIADLILGLLDNSSGEILVDGETPRSLIDRHPGIIGYVPQKPGLVSGTILDNIALGVEAENVLLDHVDYAVENSNLSDLISDLPDGLLTDLGKSKDGLSGGQLQRIGLARALYTKPSLLILDEVTSALDGESESQITTALNAMKGSVTVIMIAHRLNTIQNADKVYFFEEGILSASGTFKQLMASNGKVKKLARLMSITPNDRENSN